MVGPIDACALLGVAAIASVEEARAAHTALARLTGPGHAGAPGLRRLVDDALAAVVRGRRSAPLWIAPDEVLGVAAPATPQQVHDAFRRVAAAVHPDRGGTHELFVTVRLAYESLLDGDERASAPPRDPWWSRPPSTPPPRPAPRPWQPPPDLRRPTRRELAWAALSNGVLVTAALSAVGAITVLLSLVSAALAVLFVMGAVLLGTFFLRPLVVDLLGAVTALRQRLLVEASDPERFLVERCFGGVVRREREDVLFAHYLDWCRAQATEPVPVWVFAERLRTLGLLLVKRARWDPGVWVGVELRPRDEHAGG